MEISKAYHSFFNGFNEISDSKNHDCLKKVLGGLKIVAYFTGIIPLGFAIAYAIDSHCGYKGKNGDLSPQEQRVQDAKANAFGQKKKLNSIVFPQFSYKEIRNSILQKYPNMNTNCVRVICHMIQSEMKKIPFEKDPKKVIETWRRERDAELKANGELDEYQDSCLWFFETQLQKLLEKK
jgi:hypothetical protein